MIDLSPQQQAGLDAVRDWWLAGADPQVFRIFGYAGTGKTTIAKLVPELLGLARGAVAYCAYTGKAAHRLRQKGCEGASTIHSLIMWPVEESTQVSPGVYERRVTFVRREMDEGHPLENVSLIICDEVSMVGESLAQDLLTFDIPMLVLGDPGQLPPIEGGGVLVQDEPDVMLTEVHRQALESPVLRLATAVRLAPSSDQWAGIPRGRHRERVGVTRASEYDQVLCWTNKLRWDVVRMLRHASGRPEGMPAVGDRVMCVANNRSLGIFNGQQFWVIDVRHSRSGVVELSLLEADSIAGLIRKIKAWDSGFIDQRGEIDAKDHGFGDDVGAFTFAQAVTVHKAQGSEWARVLVMDQSYGLYRGELDRGSDIEAAHRMRARWLYTAVTRAADTVDLARASALR